MFQSVTPTQNNKVDEGQAFLLVKSLKMTILGVIVIVLRVVLVSSQACPTWFIRQESKCECGQQINTIIIAVLECANTIKILDGFCLTYNNDTDHFGACPYNTKSRLTKSIDVPSDVSKLDEEMCGPLNRTGLLCSHCQPGDRPSSLTTRSVRNACHNR